ncbi:hypothetical protein [Anaerolinea sp.]|uniref:hypothetical protein n=1 Tax=Anaerolinea sp. TaxID=1872519 RepID=UPI00263829F1|nr:hypothetical protein [uncultured Anaerolinea sp.]
MPSSFYSARVTYANGIAASGVQVRLYDRDAPDGEDDDLTITPGMSDAQGFFTVGYDPSRARDVHRVQRVEPRNPPWDWTPVEREVLEPDPHDSFQPYLLFTYLFQGREVKAVADLKSPHYVYALQEIQEKRFVPSIHGFRFINSFPGFFLPFSIPFFPETQSSSVYGLCGGMSSAALDFFLMNLPVPSQTQVPPTGTSLHQYLYQRQLDSFGMLGAVIRRFIEWMGLPDEGEKGTLKRTLDEFEKIRTRLNRFSPVPLGIQYVKWRDTHQVWQNHQVLALHYTRPTTGEIHLFLYDPNHPGRDDVYIEAHKVSVGQGKEGLRCFQRIGNERAIPLYGFFALPYQPAIPPAILLSG